MRFSNEQDEFSVGIELHARQIPFVLGHALSMKAIHGGKSKNDSHKIATMLRAGMLPMAV